MRNIGAKLNRPSAPTLMDVVSGIQATGGMEHEKPLGEFTLLVTASDEKGVRHTSECVVHRNFSEINKKEKLALLLNAVKSLLPWEVTYFDTVLRKNNTLFVTNKDLRRALKIPILLFVRWDSGPDHADTVCAPRKFYTWNQEERLAFLRKHFNFLGYPISCCYFTRACRRRNEVEFDEEIFRRFYPGTSCIGIGTARFVSGQDNVCIGYNAGIALQSGDQGQVYLGAGFPASYPYSTTCSPFTQIRVTWGPSRKRQHMLLAANLNAFGELSHSDRLRNLKTRVRGLSWPFRAMYYHYKVPFCFTCTRKEFLDV